MGFITVDPRPAIFHHWYHELGVVWVVMFSNLLNQAGSTQSLPAMNILENAFSNVTATDKLWFMGAFPLTSGALILISGKFGDLYGLKKVLLYGCVWAALWTMLGGLSGYTDSVVFFCFCRAMHGVGLAFIFPSAVGVAGTIYPNGQRKAIVFSMVGAMAPTGATCGVVFGALTAQFGHWQWAYYANAIAFVILGLIAYFAIPDIPRHAAPEVTMDWLGSAVGVSGLVLFNFASNQAPQVGWDSPYVIVLYVVGFLLILSFFYIERRVKYPLLPMEIMNYQTLLVLTPVACGWGSFSIYMFYYWCFLLNLKDYTPLAGSATYVTFVVFGYCAAGSVAMFIRKVRPSWILLAANAGFFIGITMLANTPVDQTYFNMLIAQMAIQSFGMDLSFPASSLILSDALPKKHQGMASSLVSTMINYAMSISLGYAGTAEIKVYESTGSLLKSYRAAEYVGIGFGTAGLILALILHVLSYIHPHHMLTDAEESVIEGDDENALELDEPSMTYSPPMAVEESKKKADRNDSNSIVRVSTHEMGLHRHQD